MKDLPRVSRRSRRDLCAAVAWQTHVNRPANMHANMYASCISGPDGTGAIRKDHLLSFSDLFPNHLHPGYEHKSRRDRNNFMDSFSALVKLLSLQCQINQKSNH